MIDYLLKRENFIHLIRYLANLFIVESYLLGFRQLSSTETRMMSPLYDYLKRSLNQSTFESVLSLLETEFGTMARGIDNLTDDREYLKVIQLVEGVKLFYDVLLRKKNLVTNDIVIKQQSNEIRNDVPAQ